MSKKGWLSENIAPLLALLWTIFTFYTLRLVLLKEIKVAENITFLIINTISNICMIIIGYHFGSSAGSKAKQDAIDKMADNTTTSTNTTSKTKTNEGLSDTDN